MQVPSENFPTFCHSRLYGKDLKNIDFELPNNFTYCSKTKDPRETRGKTVSTTKATITFAAPADDDDGLLHKLDLKVQAEFDGVINNIRDKLKEHLDSIHGGTCITDDQCSPISYCSKSCESALGI